MTTLHFVLRDGTTQDVEASAGESLMQAATRAGVPGIIGECGGEMSCATCHVHISSPWKERLRPASEEEMELLEMAERVGEDSRLGCQVVVGEELDGMTATVATDEF